jgi:deoxyribose-phosphate aldolase
VGIDLNALAAQLASQLATAQYPGRDAAGGPRDGLPPDEHAPPPRGVVYAEGEVRLGDFVDHTLLRPDATLADVERLCGEALEHRLAAVCLNPVWVADAARLLRGSGVLLATVVGFPFGASHADIKAAEALLAVRQGAHELDVVVPLGALRAGHWGDVERDVAAVVRAADGALVKVVLESALLAPMELVTACLVARDAGAHYVKTSTGFHAAGGATVETVALMRLAVGDSLGVKASGGVRDGATALAMLAAGATRVGTSAGASLAEVRGPGPRRLRSLLARGRRPVPTPPGAAPAVPFSPPGPAY